MATKRAAAPILVDWNNAVLAAEARLRTSRFVKASELTRLGVPKAQHAEFLLRLAAKGFERVKTGVRAPLVQQIVGAVAERKQVALKGLEKLLAGATAREVKVLASELVVQGRVRRLLRGKTEWLTVPDIDVLAVDELRVVQRVALALAAASKKALANQRSKLALWRRDTDELIAELDAVRTALANPSALGCCPASTNVAASDSQRILAALIEETDDHLQLAYVPAAVRRSDLAEPAAQMALLALAEAGSIELRADSGSTRFSEDDLRVAPPGPDGSRLLWARIVEGRS